MCDVSVHNYGCVPDSIIAVYSVLSQQACLSRLVMDRIDRQQPGWVSTMLQLRLARSGQGFNKLQVLYLFFGSVD